MESLIAYPSMIRVTGGVRARPAGAEPPKRGEKVERVGSVDQPVLYEVIRNADSPYDGGDPLIARGSGGGSLPA